MERRKGASGKGRPGDRRPCNDREQAKTAAVDAYKDEAGHGQIMQISVSKVTHPRKKRLIDFSH